MDKTTIIQIIALIIGGGGLFGGIYAMLKIRPEAGQITVTAAQGALIVQTGVIDNLQEEVERLRNENIMLRKRLRELEDKIFQLTERTELMEEHSQ